MGFFQKMTAKGHYFCKVFDWSLSQYINRYKITISWYNNSRHDYDITRVSRPIELVVRVVTDVILIVNFITCANPDIASLSSTLLKRRHLDF